MSKMKAWCLDSNFLPDFYQNDRRILTIIENLLNISLSLARMVLGENRVENTKGSPYRSNIGSKFYRGKLKGAKKFGNE